MKTDCADVYRYFFAPGEVAEIRALDLGGKNKIWEGFSRGTVSGYFNNADDFGRCARDLDAAGAKGVYFTLNPCDPALLARAENRLKAAGAKTLTTDKNIAMIRWLPVDVDPERPAEVSSSKSELEAARDVARDVREFLVKDVGWPEPIVACSGNGWHLVFRVGDLPNAEDTVERHKRCLAALQARFGTDYAKIDRSVFNASRIWKLYGTKARKGDSTRERPHRWARIVSPVNRVTTVSV